MAEVHPTPVATTRVLPVHETTLTQLQRAVDALKQEVKDLRTMVGSVVKEIKDMKQVKAEAVSGIFFQLPPLSTCARHSRLRSASVRQEHYRSFLCRLFFLGYLSHLPSLPDVHMKF